MLEEEHSGAPLFFAIIPMQVTNTDLIHYLSGFVTPRRKQLMTDVLSNRTRYITIALEDIYQPHNASAVLRTCECLGIQDVHVIENKNRYRVNPDVALGAAKWITLKKYNRTGFNTLSAIDHLRANGYRIVATSLSDEAVPPDRFNLEKGKIAIFFGTELTGLTGDMLQQADESLKIPVYGFTESYNISVSAAIILSHFIHVLHQSDISWQLTDEEKEEIMLQWLRKSMKRADLLEKEFLDSK
jgi:tRNA (guanosine-2'-O-)-methyltransferase